MTRTENTDQGTPSSRRKAQPRPTEPRRAPTVAGAQSFQKTGWLPDDVPLDWLRDLRAEHEAAVETWGLAVDACGALVEQLAEEAATSKRRIREALVAGGTVPMGSQDEAVAEAKLSLAREQATQARDDLAEVVLRALGALRRRVRELGPHLDRLSPDLLAALSATPSGRADLAAERIRRELAAFDDGRPNIEIVGADTPLTNEGEMIANA